MNSCEVIGLMKQTFITRRKMFDRNKADSSNV